MVLRWIRKPKDNISEVRLKDEVGRVPHREATTRRNPSLKAKISAWIAEFVDILFPKYKSGLPLLSHKMSPIPLRPLLIPKEPSVFTLIVPQGGEIHKMWQ